MDGKAVRLIVTFGVIGTLLLAVMMMFTLDQATDTHMPQIAADIAAEFQPSLAGEPRDAVRLTMRREIGPPSRRVYTLELRPNAAIAGAKPSLATFMYDASKLCALEIGDVSGEVQIRCVAKLPDGAAKETTYVREKEGVESGIDVIREIAATAPAQPGTPQR